MSMISGLIDKLRKSEQEWNQSNMFELARMCREAADTIWELRDDLQQTNAENAKLIVKLNAEHIVRQNVEAENTKLRELVADMWRDRDALSYGAAIPTLERMRELGIEVG